MLKAVYFPEEMCDRLPQPYRLSYFYAYPDNRGITLTDIVKAIQAGELVMIRPASETELKRAELQNVGYEIGQALFAQQAGLLDQEPEEVVKGRATQLRAALESVDRPTELLDREMGSVPPFADAPPLPNFTNERSKHDEPTNGRAARCILGIATAFARFRNACTGPAARAVRSDSRPASTK